MNLYTELSNIYKNSLTNLFTITGNFNDLKIDNNLIDINKNILIKSLSLKNHVITYSPSEGLNYFNNKDKEEFYSLDKNLEKEHNLIFKQGYSNSHYNIVGGLHIIKEMIESYRQMRMKYGVENVKNLIVFIDYADIVFPIKQIDQMSIDEKMAISIIREITSNSNFMNGTDAVILTSNSFNSISDEVRILPNNHNINVKLPDYNERLDFIKYINKEKSYGYKKAFKEEIAIKTAGLDLITLNVILKKGKEYIDKNLIKDVANILSNKLGQHIEIFYPKYGFDSVIGYDKLKEKAKTLIKRMYGSNPWRGLSYIGPTGSGKDFQTEAFLYESKLPILKLKTIKSKWYGETAIILENIKQVARSFDKVVLFKPEADKLFPDPEDKGGHQTDQEVAGLFLDWMSDSNDSGKIFWVFNTSRPQMFPVDFQRRIEIKLPILDIEDEDDRYEFIKKMFKIKKIDLLLIKLDGFSFDELKEKEINIKNVLIYLTNNYSSGNIQMLVSEVAAELEVNKDANIIDIILDLNIATVVEERDEQTKYAKEFSTYKSLI